MKITLHEPIPAALADAIAESRAAIREWREEHGDAGSTNAQVAASEGLIPVSASPVHPEYTSQVPHHVGRSFAYEAMVDPVQELMIQAFMQGAAEVTIEGAAMRGIDGDESTDTVCFAGLENWHAIPAHVEVESCWADHIDVLSDGREQWTCFSATLRSSMVAPLKGTQ